MTTTQQAAPSAPPTDVPAKKRRKSGKATKEHLEEGTGRYASVPLSKALSATVPDAPFIPMPDSGASDTPDALPADGTDEKPAQRATAARYTVTIHEMPATERPRERLTHYGASALSTTELLAIQLRIGTRERSAVGLAELLLSHFGGLRGVSNASVEELGKVKGSGRSRPWRSWRLSSWASVWPHSRPKKSRASAAPRMSPTS